MALLRLHWGRDAYVCVENTARDWDFEIGADAVLASTTTTVAGTVGSRRLVECEIRAAAPTLRAPQTDNSICIL